MDSLEVMRENRKGLKELINRYSWDIFGTGTFAYEVSETEARKKTEEFFQNCESRLRSSIPRFWVLEPHESIESYHIHFLLAGVQNINENVPQILYNKWREISGKGIFRTDKYDAGRNSESYLTKYLLKETSYYEVKNLDSIDIRYQDYGAFDLKHAIRTLKEKDTSGDWDNQRYRRVGGYTRDKYQNTTKADDQYEGRYILGPWKEYFDS